MRKIIADSSALILLAKCGLLETLCARFELIIPPAVAGETASETLSRTYPDAALILKLISAGTIRVRKPSSRKSLFPFSLHRGEKACLELAFNMSDVLFATDDGKAIKAARTLKIPFIITPKIVAELHRVGAISLKDARKCIKKLGTIGRYSPEILADALLSLMEEGHGKTDNHKNT